MLSSYTRELDVAITAIRKAGDIIQKQYTAPTGVQQKEDGTLVCAADKESSALLTSILRESFPHYGLLDEEQEDDQSRHTKEHCWVIDPLDSTRDYLEKKEGYGIIISLLQHSVPVLALTYQPHKDQLAYALRGEGSFLIDHGSQRRLSVASTNDIHLSITRTRSTPELENIITQLQPKSITRRGGMIKIVDVAKGETTLCLAPPGNQYHLWDIASPALILEEAGGKMTDWHGQPLRYNQEVKFQNGFIASNGVVHQKVLSVSGPGA